MSTLRQCIEKTITRETGAEFLTSGESPIGGGCIHSAACLTGVDGRQFFIKQNDHDLLPPFEAEAFALNAISATATIRVPHPIGTATTRNQAALILEFLPMGTGRPGGWKSMGRQLAKMHRCRSGQHGWPHDNWIGSTSQINTTTTDWIEFYIKCRLHPQVEWARQKHLSLKEVDQLIEALPGLYAQYNPSPSLLHGDLWAGNAGFLSDGTPVIFDPAAYYGDREADLAMTEMFGGYPKEFYEGYNTEWPLDPGYPTRKYLHLLYHTLNHYNLFGGGYGAQAQSIIRQLIASLSGN